MPQLRASGIVLVALVVMLGAPLGAAAAPDSGDLNPLEPPFHKAGRGVANTLTGWLEIPLTMDKQWHASNDKAENLFAGIGLGLFKAVVRTAVGLYEVVTFPLPVPAYYAPILPPLEYFTHTPRFRPLPLE